MNFVQIVLIDGCIVISGRTFESVRSVKILQAYFLCLTETSQDPIQRADAEFMLNLANEYIEFEDSMLIMNLGGAVGVAADMADEDASLGETALSLASRIFDGYQFERQKDAEWLQLKEKAHVFGDEIVARIQSFPHLRN